MDKKVIIGIDQSYTDTGIAITTKGVVRNAFSVPLSGYSSETEKRMALKENLIKVIDKCIDNCYNEIEIYIEQVRINKGKTTFDYLKRAGAMEALIIDIVYMHKYIRAHEHIKLYSVSTNAWKSKILGGRQAIKNSSGIDQAKYATFQFLTQRKKLSKYVLQKASKQTRNYVYKDDDGNKWKYNDNIGDAICIALYGYINEKDTTRKELL